jgi:acetate kinase
MSTDLLLTLNAGSSTIKIALFEVAPSGTRRAAKGLIDFRGDSSSFRITEGAATCDVNLKTDVSDIRGIMAEAFGWLAMHFDVSRIKAVGHRVVHGGDSFAGPIRIDDVTLEAIAELTMLAPLQERPSDPRYPASAVRSRPGRFL